MDNTAVCRQCKEKHDRAKAMEVLGEYSPAYSTGFCSDLCYQTFKEKSIIHIRNEPKESEDN